MAAMMNMSEKIVHFKEGDFIPRFGGFYTSTTPRRVGRGVARGDIWKKKKNQGVYFFG